MTYNFFTVDRLQPPLLSNALASCINVEPSTVDVADVDGDQDDRNWDAHVLCDYTHVFGNVSLTLDIFVQDAVPNQPNEADAAKKFAAAAQTVVLYPAAEQIPSAYWLVTPTGLLTRARLVATDDERPTYSIDAVEAAIPQLPGVRVMQLPEIVRERRVPTPVTADFTRAVDALRRSQHGSVNAALIDEPGTPLNHSRNYLAEWERMVRIMASNWQPTGRYPIELYCDALRARDFLAHLSAKLPQPVDDLLQKAVDQLDARFRSHTQLDDTWAIEAGTSDSSATMENPGWWWHRKPLILPWDGN
ncbi:hypothetical protein I2W78_20875 [Streptomyces spinoverrucosus]|uniref:hypothetical protein n=1 Tax=Streptomyces spinoverrucosus TaxID=284043 RepID=UPI0018C3F5E4|nr:hypothetical protein [Streptomyces spinoverrucosus]MBG0854220.1 hypothetical protein [Streptomyces spinoverrucosus]